MDTSRILKKSSNLRIVFILLLITIMLFSLGMIYSMGSGIVDNGKTDLSKVEFSQRELVALDGSWEFYWNQLLTPEDFTYGYLPKIDSLMKVPGSWHDKEAGTKVYPNHGVATYRLLLNYPYTLKDPALRIQRIASAYKLYANGKLITEVGVVSKKTSDYKLDYKQLIIELPKEQQQLELIIQVANLDYARGGLRESPVFGSKQVLEQHKIYLLALQLLFIGSVFIFGIHYLLVFLLQRKNKTTLIFSILCFIVAFRSSVWGETPLKIFFPNMPIEIGIYITYITGYNLMPIIIFFVLSIHPLGYKKKMLCLILLPNLFFETLLLTPIGFMASFNNYHFSLMLLQMIYILSILIKEVLHKSDNAIIMLIAIEVFIFSILADILNNKGIGSITISYMFLYGNFAVIIAMSYVQAKQYANTHNKLIIYNEKLVDADKLKDKIMATEMSFLQAQIKPHFLYNSLNAIANVCEVDGEKASKLIVDLAIYLRGSLEFNNLDKMLTIEKELEFVGTYFNIEQARFGGKIQLIKEIEIPLEFEIPVLILQPLVENAVRHGISKKPGGGSVYVRIKQTVEGTNIEIEDDGVGIHGEILAMILSEERLDKGVGLLNIHHRLLRLYGRGLDISSQVGRGTCVRLVIPEGRK
ncbi:sensor histidine kinase [Clostridium sp. CF012]|uniref:sensor histidine kinase n=1 Tax=Clostridium sp. CF012 TaxID=2843319 RepID=UPI001C0AC7F7|nr:histidine kinase [Clostridium sp. CF012]MBU3144373.1 histidine kinase [Clostridium sp. CF012]